MTLNVSGTQGSVTGVLDFAFDTKDGSNNWVNRGFANDSKEVIIFTTPSTADTMTLVNYTVSWEVALAASIASGGSGYARDAVTGWGQVVIPGISNVGTVVPWRRFANSGYTSNSSGVIESGSTGSYPEELVRDTVVTPNSWYTKNTVNIPSGADLQYNYGEYYGIHRASRVSAVVGGEVKLGPATPLKMSVVTRSWQANNNSNNTNERIFQMRYTIAYTATNIKNP